MCLSFNACNCVLLFQKCSLVTDSGVGEGVAALAVAAAEIVPAAEIVAAAEIVELVLVLVQVTAKTYAANPVRTLAVSDRPAMPC